MSKDFQFEGFDSPNFTPTPDALFDVLAPELTEAELRVLLYVIRRTFGFRKDSDAISTAQMTKGITTKDGRVLDKGTGMSKSAVWRGCKGLIEKGILEVQHVTSPQGDSDINVYRLHFREGVTLLESNGYSPKEQRVTLKESTQERVNNKTGNKGKDIQTGRKLTEAEELERYRRSAEGAGMDLSKFEGG